MAAPGTIRRPTRCRCSCTVEAAIRWLNLHTRDALTDGDEVAALLGEVADHFLAVARRAA